MKKRYLVLIVLAILVIVPTIWFASSELPNWKLDRATTMALESPSEAIPPADLPDKNWVYMDARTEAEYNISHIPGAIFIGDGSPDQHKLYSIPQNQPLLVYCSMGKRSEAITDSLRMMGFEDVTNLFGGLFAWAEEGYPLVNHAGQPTDTLHGYDSFWASLSKMENVVME